MHPMTYEPVLAPSMVSVTSCTSNGITATSESVQPGTPTSGFQHYLRNIRSSMASPGKESVSAFAFSSEPSPLSTSKPPREDRKSPTEPTTDSGHREGEDNPSTMEFSNSLLSEHVEVMSPKLTKGFPSAPLKSCPPTTKSSQPSGVVQFFNNVREIFRTKSRDRLNSTIESSQWKTSTLNLNGKSKSGKPSMRSVEVSTTPPPDSQRSMSTSFHFTEPVTTSYESRSTKSSLLTTYLQTDWGTLKEANVEEPDTQATLVPAPPQTPSPTASQPLVLHVGTVETPFTAYLRTSVASVFTNLEAPQELSRGISWENKGTSPITIPAIFQERVVVAGAQAKEPPRALDLPLYCYRDDPDATRLSTQVDLDSDTSPQQSDESFPNESEGLYEPVYKKTLCPVFNHAWSENSRANTSSSSGGDVRNGDTNTVDTSECTVTRPERSHQHMYQNEKSFLRDEESSLSIVPVDRSPLQPKTKLAVKSEELRTPTPTKPGFQRMGSRQKSMVSPTVVDRRFRDSNGNHNGCRRVSSGSAFVPIIGRGSNQASMKGRERRLFSQPTVSTNSIDFSKSPVNGKDKPLVVPESQPSPRVNGHKEVSPTQNGCISSHSVVEVSSSYYEVPEAVEEKLTPPQNKEEPKIICHPTMELYTESGNFHQMKEIALSESLTDSKADALEPQSARSSIVSDADLIKIVTPTVVRPQNLQIKTNNSVTNSPLVEKNIVPQQESKPPQSPVTLIAPTRQVLEDVEKIALPGTQLGSPGACILRQPDSEKTSTKGKRVQISPSAPTDQFFFPKSPRVQPTLTEDVETPESLTETPKPKEAKRFSLDGLNDSPTVPSQAPDPCKIRRRSHITKRPQTISTPSIRENDQKTYSVSSETYKNVNPETHFKKREKIGKGKFGTVWRCEDLKTKQVAAIKEVETKGLARHKSGDIMEVAVLRSIGQHDNIACLFGAYELGGICFIVTEFVSGGALYDRIVAEDNLDEKISASIIRQILLGLQHIQSCSVLHLDLKPENIMMVAPSGYQLKIIDFGVAYFYDPKVKQRKIQGTFMYSAPETINYDYQTFETDVWSIAVIAYELLSGITPFEFPPPGQPEAEVTLAMVTSNIIQCRYDFEDDGISDVSDMAKDFIRKILKKNPKDRPTVKQCLQHPWIKTSEGLSTVRRAISIRRRTSALEKTRPFEFERI